VNRRKKGIQILKARAKKANAKLSSSNKPKYISKAERAKIAAQQAIQAEGQEGAATETQTVESSTTDKNQ
jgi:hypothetical protein